VFCQRPLDAMSAPLARSKEAARVTDLNDGGGCRPGKLSWMGRAAHPPSELVRYEMAPPKAMRAKPPPPGLGPGSEEIHERLVDTKQVWSLVYGTWRRSDAVAPFLPGPHDEPLPPFFRRSVMAPNR
jgi:hypothetical protein